MSPDGSTVFVTGGAGHADARDYMTRAYRASDGTFVGMTVFAGGANLDDVPDSIAVSPTGDAVFVTGSSESSPGDHDYATVAYST